ncbi:MAG: MBOAT family O-acyltransferase, partial [Anaerovoracaceae bacterium]
GGNRVGKVRHNLNLMITFLVSGFWHGANWTFILWGGLHGLYQIIEQTLFRRKNHRLFDKEGKYQGQLFRWILGVMVTFVLAAFAWIFFRANSIGDAVYVVTHLLDGITDPVTYLKQGYALIGGSISSVMFIAIPILLLTVYDFFSLKTDLILAMEKRGIVFRWIVYLLLGVLILLFATKGEGAEFVYLQF